MEIFLNPTFRTFKALRIIFYELHTDKNPLKEVLYTWVCSHLHVIAILFFSSPIFNTILQGTREGMD